MVTPDFWKNKKVFLTGHTGFKGSWMSLWLLKMGAQLTGFSNGYPTEPSMMKDIGLEKEFKSLNGDIRNPEQIENAILECNPDILIHMAAQPLVRYSYQAPIETYMTNVMGLVNVFEACRKTKNLRAILNVTSDKCYENKERLSGYKEDEAMGGFDPYSSSKGCAELVTAAYRRSYFLNAGVGLASGRAGNVIGGGDWAQDRLVPDIVRSVQKNEILTIRNPEATRPWQHVLEPLSGYLCLTEKLFENPMEFSEGFNFGPSDQDHASVQTIIEKMNHLWNQKIKYEIKRSDSNPHEAHYLSLNCDKAKEKLGWEPKINLDYALKMTVEWYEEDASGSDLLKLSNKQIEKYKYAKL